MPAPKGTRPPNAGKGRPKGVPNKVTKGVQEALRTLVEANQSKMQTVLDAAYTKDPFAWWDMMKGLMEYAAPKLARVENTIEGELTVATRLVIKAPTSGA